MTVKELWQKLGDIPIDGNECIEKIFLHFPKGTHRGNIWHWFEDTFNVEVHNLMYRLTKGGKN